MHLEIALEALSESKFRYISTGTTKNNKKYIVYFSCPVKLNVYSYTECFFKTKIQNGGRVIFRRSSESTEQCVCVRACMSVFMLLGFFVCVCDVLFILFMGTAFTGWTFGLLRWSPYPEFIFSVLFQVNIKL